MDDTLVLYRKCHCNARIDCFHTARSGAFTDSKVRILQFAIESINVHLSSVKRFHIFQLNIFSTQFMNKKN
jgi:hypothetical protein